MRLPPTFFDQLRNNIRISEVVGRKVRLTRKRGEHSGLCPFHNEKTPSFTVNDMKKFYHCFGCGAHGDIIQFVAQTDGMGYKNAAIKLAEEFNIPVPKMSSADEAKYDQIDRLHALLNLAQEFFVKQLDRSIIAYLEKRGLISNTISQFGIGYIASGSALEDFLYEQNFTKQELLKSGLFGTRDSGKLYSVFNARIMFPIKNIFNKIVAFGGRAVGDAMPKYINSPETILFKKSEIMFGQNVANSHIYKDNYAIIVEGYMDVIALHQAGFKHAVASLGTAVTEQHLKQLWHCCDELVICLDGDEAGQRASNKIIHMALPVISAKKRLSFIEMPPSLDPDNVIKQGGAGAFARYLNDRISLSQKIWLNEYLDKTFNTPESIALLEDKLKSQYNQILDQGLRSNFSRYFSNMIWQNIIRAKKTMTNIKSVSYEIKNVENISEIEFLERAICAFICNFPAIASSEDLHSIKLNDQQLEHFKSWLADHIDENSNYESLALELKNSRFLELFQLFCDSKKRFLYNAIIDQETSTRKIFFSILRKKHYLFMLKSEYADLLRHDDQTINLKSESYLKEIQRVSHEINELSEE